MIYQAILKIRGKEIPILYYSYRCHIQHCDDPNLRRIIQLHIEACEKTGNREYLPVEGDLITLMFECSGDEQFFYDWLNIEGTVHSGEIHFIYNEVEIVDIFQFQDCFCLKIEESMSAVNFPMVMTVYLSPGIIKRNNLDVREKEWGDKNKALIANNIVYSKFHENSSSTVINNSFSKDASIGEIEVKSQEELEELLCEMSKQAWRRAEYIAKLLPQSNGSKTVCSDGIVTVSGYSKRRVSKKFRQQVPNMVDVPISSVIEEALKLNHKLRENSSIDNGIPGSSSASHAEKQMLVKQKNEMAFGVNRKICECCYEFIQKTAETTGNTIFITQPVDVTYIFSPTSGKGRIYKIGNTKI
ncbi:type VI secretion system tube protein TssD [Bacteroides sp. An19]|uniref:type VI secretion system tube protein TssD n=1 Tax=Bacteroides sp. An19 TaxID=1965580 RepID=UPI000B39367F|nr:type VI secretion system tube protein TssD [Bacteroides sp. An19]OUP36229.1 hypothetical protein B5F25_03510 [Bacteroides sp. An19]